MTPRITFHKRWLAPLALVMMAMLIILAIALIQLGDATGSATAQPTPCPDSIACRAIKRYDALRTLPTATP